MTMDVAVRQYSEGDLEGCRNLWRELTERHREIYSDPTIGGDDPGRFFDEHLSRVGAENLWVASVGDDVVAMLGLVKRDDEVEMEPVVVSPDFRGQGIGRKLVELAFDEARAAGATFLSVRPVARNAEAIKFFRGCGLEAVGHVELFADLRKREWRSGLSLHGMPFDY